MYVAAIKIVAPVEVIVEKTADTPGAAIEAATERAFNLGATEVVIIAVHEVAE